MNYAVLGATALKSVVSTASGSVRNPMLNAMINDVADRVIDTAVLNQHVRGPVLAVQTAGSLVGSYIGTRTLQALKTEADGVSPDASHSAQKQTSRASMQHQSVPQKIENQRAVHLSATEDDAQQTGLSMDDVTFNVPDPVLPLGDTIHADPATYALSEMNSRRMQRRWQAHTKSMQTQGTMFSTRRSTRSVEPNSMNGLLDTASAVLDSVANSQIISAINTTG